MLTAGTPDATRAVTAASHNVARFAAAGETHCAGVGAEHSALAHVR